MLRTRTRRDRATTFESMFLRGVSTIELPSPVTRGCTNCGQPFLGAYLVEIQTICPSCVAEHVRLSEQDARDSRYEERVRSLERIGLTGRLQSLSFERFAAASQPSAYDAAKNFVAAFPDLENLILLGKPGCGKTHLAVAMLIELLAGGYELRYVHVPTLTADLRGAIGADGWQAIAGPAFAAMRRSDCLVLDDLGREKSSDALAEQLDAVVNARWVEGAPTIICANLELVDLVGAEGTRGLLSEANVSRLGERLRVVQMRDYDWRLSPGVRPEPNPKLASTLEACSTCAGAGWLQDGALPIGHRDRLMKCPTCQGRRY